MPKQKSKQKLRKKKKKRSRRRKKSKERRKDAIVGMPFIIAYQGDPARKYRCGQGGASNYKAWYDLIPWHPNCKKRNRWLKGFDMLRRYAQHRVQFINKNGLMLHIKNAP